MAKFKIVLDESSPDDAIEDLMEQLEMVFSFQDSDLRDELTKKVEERIGRIAEDICAGLARPEFEKAIEDAKQRVITAVQEAFDYQPKKRA